MFSILVYCEREENAMNQKLLIPLCRSKPLIIAFMLFCLTTTVVIIVSDNPASAQASDTTNHNRNIQLLYNQLLGRLPFRGAPTEYYGLFPGVVRQDFRGIENLHVRGSRPDEIAYSFEGADIRSAFTGRNLFRIIPEALDQIELHISPSASNSHASVLFQHRLRRGGEDFKLSLRGESDRFTHSYEKRLGTFSYGYNNLLLLSEGKFFKDNIHFFVAGKGNPLLITIGNSGMDSASVGPNFRWLIKMMAGAYFRLLVSIRLSSSLAIFPTLTPIDLR
jgi:hypothetical protein